MNSKSMHHLNIEFAKPLIALAIVHGITLTDVSDTIKVLTACVALGYAIWKWVSDAKKK